MGRQQLTAFEDNNTEQWFDAEEIEEIDLTSLIPRDGWLEFQKPESKIEKRGHTKINSLLSQNPVGWDSIINDHSDGSDSEGYMPQYHYAPKNHPKSFDPFHDYWDERLYESYKSGYKNTFYLKDAFYFTCPNVNSLNSNHIIYINPANHQTFVFCKWCKHHSPRSPWHQIKDAHDIKGIVQTINEDHGYEVLEEPIVYRKQEIAEAILGWVESEPGINKYQLRKKLNSDEEQFDPISKGQITRGIARLKKDHKIRTRRAGKAMCIYPISN